MLFKCTKCNNLDGSDRLFEADESYESARAEDRDAANKTVAFCPNCGAPRSDCEPA